MQRRCFLSIRKKRGGGEGGRLKSASLSFLLAFTSFLSLSLALSVLNALQSLYLPQGACPFFLFLVTFCVLRYFNSIVCIYTCVYVCVFLFGKCDRMRIYLSFVISFVAADWLLLLLLLLLALFLSVLFCFRVTVRVLLVFSLFCFL